MSIVVVTGTPGTGKTTLSKSLASERGYEYIDVKGIIEQKGISDGFDIDMDCEIIDTDKLNSVLIDLIKKADSEKKDLVIDSHLSHHIPKEYVDLCIVTRCPIEILKNRLEKRGYSENKVRENLDAEIMDVCKIEALENGLKVTEIDTSKECNLTTLGL